MLEKDKIQFIEKIARETDIHELLYDLLPLMGYRNTILTHEKGNVPEYGKDLIASRLDEIEGVEEWTAFVVKKGDITGTSRMNMEIASQIEECFKFPYDSLKHGRIKISKVKVVTNGKLTSGALQKFNKDVTYTNPNVSFWRNDDLVKHIDKYYPRFWLKGSKVYKHYIELFQEKNKHDDFTKTLGLNNNKIEKLLNNAIRVKLVESFYDARSGFKNRSFNIEDLNKINDCSLIVGESGSGKTTLFRQISNNIIFENSLRNDYEFYPIVMKFSDIRDNEFDLIKAIKAHFSAEPYKNLQINVDELIGKCNFILFLDALDEIGENDAKDRALEAIKNFHREQPTIKIVCSSRNSDSLLGTCRKLNFRYFRINNVSIAQAESFISRYFQDDQIKSERLIKSLKDSRILDKLPQTPLTLTLLTSLFDENGYEIPATISDLYKYFVDILLNKNIKESHLDLLKVGVHKSVLSFIAEHLHTNRSKSIAKNDLHKLISHFALDRAQTYNVEDLLNDLIHNISLLVENDRGEIEFKHLSFQEYFAAYQFYNHSINGKTNFIENFNDIWWQNVAIFYAGMTKDSPQLIAEILEASKPKEFHEYLINVAGLGYLIQALYNTPVTSRLEAIKRNIDNINDALKFILQTKDEKYKEIKTFLHTTYGAHKILSTWYEFHHSSITLKDPLNSLFEKIIEELSALGENISEERSQLEYTAYLLASSLITIEYDDFDRFFKLLKVVHKDNFHVQGLIDSDFNNTFKSLSKDEKARKSIKKFQLRLSFLNDEKIEKEVNLSILDGSRLPMKKRNVRK